MTFRSTRHSWAFIAEVDYDPSTITPSHYEANSVVLSASERPFRCLEWTGDLLPELEAWDVFQDAAEAAEYLEQN
tara:strand:- start:695 stop:919 length:225 start_codon:yes stop_codon:yes gene_type:complete